MGSVDRERRIAELEADNKRLWTAITVLNTRVNEMAAHLDEYHGTALSCSRVTGPEDVDRAIDNLVATATYVAERARNR